MREFEAVSTMLSPFSKRTGCQMSYLYGAPDDHCYPAGEVGAIFRGQNMQDFDL